MACQDCTHLQYHEVLHMTSGYSWAKAYIDRGRSTDVELLAIADFILKASIALQVRGLNCSPYTESQTI